MIMCRRSCFFVLFFPLFFALLDFSLVFALEHTDFSSLYQIDQELRYCSSASSSSSGFPCEEAGFMGSVKCGSSNSLVDYTNYPYLCTDLVHGFSFLYDFSDSKLCSNMDAGEQPCQLDEYALSTMAPTEYGRLWGSFSSLARFRVYVPPGTRDVNLTLYIPRDDQTALVARFKSTPDADHFSDGTAYADLPVTHEDSVNLALLQDQDVYMKNSGGHMTIKFAVSASSGLSNGEAGWIYVYLKSFYGNNLNNLLYTVHVVPSVYEAWFGEAEWDVCGDPMPSGQYDAPSSEGMCLVSGGSSYDYGGSSGASSGSSGASSGGASSGSSSGSADQGGGCTSSDPTGCSNSYQCEMAGGCWYNNACIVKSGSSCPVDSSSGSSGSSGSSSGSSGSSSSNSALCVFTGTCDTSSGSSDSSSSASSGSSSGSADQGGGCTSSDPTGCSNSYQCEVAGGCWVDDACIVKSGSSCPSDSSSASQQQGDNSAGDDGAVEECDSGHLDLCLDWNGCHDAGGCVDSNGQCVECGHGSAPSVSNGEGEDCTDGHCDFPVCRPYVSEERLYAYCEFPEYDEDVYLYVAIAMPDGAFVFWNGELEEVFAGSPEVLLSDITMIEGGLRGAVLFNGTPLCVCGLGGRKVPIVPDGEYLLAWLVTGQEPPLDSLTLPYEMRYTTFNVPECSICVEP